MKNKNIKNKSQKCDRWLFLHSRFSKIFWTPLLKGLYQLNPQNLSSTTTTAKGWKALRHWNNIQEIYLQVIQKLKKGGGRWGKIFLVWFVIGLFETLICAIAEDKVCDSCIVSSWALLIFFYFVCDDSDFLCCVITQNGESNLDLLLSVTNRKLWLQAQPPEPPLKH